MSWVSPGSPVRAWRRRPCAARSRRWLRGRCRPARTWTPAVEARLGAEGGGARRGRERIPSGESDFPCLCFDCSMRNGWQMHGQAARDAAQTQRRTRRAQICAVPPLLWKPEDLGFRISPPGSPGGLIPFPVPLPLDPDVPDAVALHPPQPPQVPGATGTLPLPPRLIAPALRWPDPGSQVAPGEGCAATAQPGRPRTDPVPARSHRRQEEPRCDRLGAGAQRQSQVR